MSGQYPLCLMCYLRTDISYLLKCHQYNHCHIKKSLNMEVLFKDDEEEAEFYSSSTNEWKLHIDY